MRKPPFIARAGAAAAALALVGTGQSTVPAFANPTAPDCSPGAPGLAASPGEFTSREDGGGEGAFRLRNDSDQTVERLAITHDLTDVLDDYDWGGVRTPQGGTVALTDDILHWEGELAPDEEKHIRYDLEPPARGGTDLSDLSAPTDVLTAWSCPAGGTGNTPEPQATERSAEPSPAANGREEAAWSLTSENDPARMSCDHLYYSNFRSSAQFANDADDNATINNTVTSKRTGNQPPDYWSTNMAVGPDPDTGATTAFYSNYTTSNLTLYKHVSGTDTATDEIYNGQTRALPSGTNWGGLGMDPSSGMLWGAQNGGAPRLFAMDLTTGETTVYARGTTMTAADPADTVFNAGSIVPDMFLDSKGGAYFGISYGAATYLYRFDPATRTAAQVVRITGPASGHGFNNYGMAYLNGYVYFGHYSGILYRADPETGASQEVGRYAHDNQVGTIQTESGGSWPITDLASCATSTDLTDTSDISIRKTTSAENAAPGDTITYTVEITNNGTGDATDATVSDDLTGILDDATYNDDASATSGTVSYTEPTLTWTGDLAAGETATITYTATVANTGGDNLLANTVTGPDGSNCPPDSTDPDCATETPVARLALAKTATPTNPAIGDTVTYTVTVTNTGRAPYPDASFTDDLTPVLDDATWANDITQTTGESRFDATDRSFTWTGDIEPGEMVTITYAVTVNSPLSGDGTLTNTVTGPDGSNCPPDATDPDCTTTQNIKALTVTKTATPASATIGDTVTYTVTITNTGTTAYDDATMNDDLTDVLTNATWNDNLTADTGTATYSEPTVSWTGDLATGQQATVTYTVTYTGSGDQQLRNTATVPGSNCPPDSTDPDCTTTIPTPGLTITKLSDHDRAQTGDSLTYTLLITNTTDTDYDNATITDNLTEVLDDATYNTDATATTGTVTYTEPTLTWTGDVPAGTTTTITYTVTVKPAGSGDGTLTNTLTGPDDSNCPPDSTDPACTHETPLATYTVRKTSDPATAKPGDTLTYTVTVTNPTDTDYNGAEFTDDLTGVIDDATYNDDATATNGQVTYTEPHVSWTGNVPANATVTVTYTVTVNTPPEGDLTLTNTVTDPEGSCPPDATNLDCTTETGIAALAITKSSTPEYVKNGDTVTYTIAISNPGTAAYTGGTVEDDLSNVLDDATYNRDASATSGTVSYTEPTLTWSGDLPAGETATVTYTVTIAVSDQSDRLLDNVVTGPEDSTCPPGSGDPDCSETKRLPQLHVHKTTSAESAREGETITYTLTITNSSPVPYPDATLSDDLSNVLDDADYNADASATSGSTSYTEPTLTWTGDVPAEGTVTVTYSVTVKAAGSGDGTLANAVTTAEDGNCPPDSTDPDCGTEVPVGSYSITKTAAPDSAQAGDTVTYTVTVANTGPVAYPGATFTDDLTGVIDDAAYNRDASADDGTVTYTEPELTWEGDLATGQTVRVTYSVTVDSPPAGDKVLANAVVTPDGGPCPPDSTDPDCTTEVPLGELRLTKTADTTEVDKGDTVTYTITAENTGNGDLADAEFTDDLTGVINHADYNGDAQADHGAVSYTEPVLTWTGSLAAGEKATVTYTVTVTATGEFTMSNAVSADGSNCPSDSEDPDCATVIPPRTPATNWGDAPDSYNTLNASQGAHHETVDYLYIGRTVHRASDGKPDDRADAWASHDGTANPVDFTVNEQNPRVTVEVHNATGADATLTGWLDLSVDGGFEAAEKVETTVPPGATSATLEWDRPLEQGTTTFLRLRLFGTDSSAEQSVERRHYGAGGPGEVEDYLVRRQAEPAPGDDSALPLTGQSAAKSALTAAALLTAGGLLWLAATRRRRL
ncbi:DUF7927 domain-containing protein [Salininema proteolyticum]|uniref:Isopeptide-forming domain-containing fimbrial protein n=1 Tax=Salininema proteolyticum TaxID=1607685 RepID=A0ABV8TV01_9ACTN